MEKKPWYRRPATFLAIVALVLAVGVLAKIGNVQQSYRVERDTLRLGEVEIQPFRETVVAGGEVEPRRVVFLDSLSGGRVEEILLPEGSVLAVGDPILRLSNPDLELEIQRLEEQFAVALDNLSNVRLEVERARREADRQLLDIDHSILLTSKELLVQEELYGEHLTARMKLEKARDENEFWEKKRGLFLESEERDKVFRQTQVEQAEEAVTRKRRNLETAREKLNKLVVEAPIPGTLTSLAVEVGQAVGPAERLGQVDAGGFKIHADIDQIYISRIRAGQGAELDRAEGASRLVIRQVYEEVTGGKFSADLEWSGEEPGDLKRGQRLTVRIDLGELSPAKIIPKGGFYQTTAGRWIFVVDPSAQFAERRDIRLGRQNDLHYEVLEGLDPGERVITSRYDVFGEVRRLVIED